jgi:hypothetical protein
MSSAKPLGPDGSDGALSPSQLARTGDERDSKFPVDHDADCSIIDELPCGYLVLDIAGTILRANRDFLRMTGRSSAETLGTSFRKYLTSAGAIYFDTQILPLLHLAGRRNEIALDLKLDSARLPVFATFALATKPVGACAQIKVILIEASERRSFERQLLQSRLEAEQLSEVIHRSSDGIITLLPTGAVRNWNNGAVANPCRIFSFWRITELTSNGRSSVSNEAENSLVRAWASTKMAPRLKFLSSSRPTWKRPVRLSPSRQSFVISRCKSLRSELCSRARN